jgi:hypothetical protein
MKTKSRLPVLWFFAVLFMYPAFSFAEKTSRYANAKIAGADTLWIDVKLEGGVDSRSVLPAKIRNQLHGQPEAEYPSSKSA